MKKEHYETVELEIIRFECEDVVMASGGDVVNGVDDDTPNTDLPFIGA